MSFGKRAVHTLEGNETAIGVTDCHAYVDGQVICLSQGSLDGPICFGKSNRHIDRLDGYGYVLHPVGRDAERRELNRAFCSSLSELGIRERWLHRLHCGKHGSRRFSIASTRPVGVSVW